MSGHMKSFHDARKVSAASVARIGRITGSTMSTRMRSSLAPSMRAASSSSSGTDCAYWRTRKMPKTLASHGTSAPV
jgi:hypothetical protein